MVGLVLVLVIGLTAAVSILVFHPPQWLSLLLLMFNAYLAWCMGNVVGRNP